MLDLGQYLKYGTIIICWCGDIGVANLMHVEVILFPYTSEQFEIPNRYKKIFVIFDTQTDRQTDRHNRQIGITDRQTLTHTVLTHLRIYF